MTDEPTAERRRRWWDDPDFSIEAEAAWFDDAGLEFSLDRDLLEHSQVVVFRGDLRLRERTTPATIVYPPNYHLGGHPLALAPELDLGRHQGPDGSLCLDHPVLGVTAPMCGAEAAERAQELWRLVEEDPERLHEVEADAPDPRWNYYECADGSGVILVDVDVGTAESAFSRWRPRSSSRCARP
jgi:hypothetical protein